MTESLRSPDFAHGRDDRYFEDYVSGDIHEYGSITVSEAEILEFATKYDPQPIHVDKAFAETGPFGGLIASGWHTSAVMMRMLADHYLPGKASLASPGVEDIAWLAPLRPDDALHIRITVADARRSNSKPDRGVVTSFVEVINQRDEVIMTMRAANFVKVREG